MVLPAWVFALAMVLLVVGWLGVLLPAVPGVGFMWVVILAYALAERLATIDPVSLAVLTLLGIVGATSDLWMGQLGAKVGGASLSSTLFSLLGWLLGGIIGLLAGGVGAIPGMIVGSVLGVFVNELREHRNWKAAWQATLGLLAGWTLSTVVQLAIGTVMLAIFAWQVLRG